MAKQYRPFILARAGELAGLARLDAGQRQTISPVLRIPERAWDYENGRYAKTHEAHIGSVPDRLERAWAGGRGYLDLSLIEKERPVGGKHPLQYLIDESDARNVTLVPLINSASTPEALAAATAVHAASGRGAAIQLPQVDWTTINATALTGLLTALAMTPSDIDVVVDFEGAAGPVTEVALIAELASLRGIGWFRSVTVGGTAFPDLAGVPQGTSEYPRTEWNVYASVRGKIAQQGVSTPDFFDHVIHNPELTELGVDPRFLSISAHFRYAVADKWLVAKGKLFKGRGTTSMGGAALVPALSTLIRHPEYASPVRSHADDWIEAVVAGKESPGAPQKWREWGTVRHLEVAASQLASLT